MPEPIARTMSGALSRQTRRELEQARQGAVVQKAKMLIDADLTDFADELNHLLGKNFMRRAEFEERLARAHSQSSAAGALIQSDILMALHGQRMWLLERGRS